MDTTHVHILNTTWSCRTGFYLGYAKDKNKYILAFLSIIHSNKIPTKGNAVYIFYIDSDRISIFVIVIVLENHEHFISNYKPLIIKI